MAGTELTGPIGDLARKLGNLGTPERLLVLSSLATPKDAAQVSASTGLGAAVVQTEITALTALGMVTRDRGSGKHVLQRSNFFKTAQDFQELGTQQNAEDGVGAEQTQSALQVSRASLAFLRRPCLLIVSGLAQGEAFALEGEGPWTIGRAAESTASLDYDAFASKNHALILKEGEGYRLKDAESSNGTFVNLQRLPKGGSQALKHGDVLGIGRSQLVFWTD